MIVFTSVWQKQTHQGHTKPSVPTLVTIGKHPPELFDIDASERVICELHVAKQQAE